MRSKQYFCWTVKIIKLMLKIRQCHWTWKIKLKTEIDKDMILVLKGISQKKKGYWYWKANYGFILYIVEDDFLPGA